MEKLSSFYFLLLQVFLKKFIKCSLCLPFFLFK